MAFIQLTNGENPKLAVSTNNALNFKSNEGTVEQRKPKTALVDVIKEAGKVAAMKKGNVMLRVSVKGEYQTYFVNRAENHNISLRPADNPQDKERTIYINSVKKEEGGYFHAINTQTKAGKELVENIDIKSMETGEQKSEYLKLSVQLKNDDLKADLVKSGPGHHAILSKEGYRVVEIDATNLKKEVKEVKKEPVKKEAAKNEKKLQAVKKEIERIKKEPVKKEAAKNEKTLPKKKVPKNIKKEPEITR